MTKKKCDCGCGSYVPNPPYERAGKQYSSAYCLLGDIKCCSYCGGYYGDDFDPEKYEYQCNCNFKALDGSYEDVLEGKLEEIE